MGHGNARLTVHGRRLLVDRVRGQGWPVAHAAKAMGVSRQCAHRWVARYDAEGDAGLEDRSSRPHRSPNRTAPEVEAAVVEARRKHRRGPDWLGPELGILPRTISRILRRHQVPYLAECDPLTGEVIRSSKTTSVRYERDRPGELIHVDVKKIGRIPPRGRMASLGTPSHHFWEETTAGRLRLCALSCRRPQPSRLFGDPPQRTRSHLRRIPGTSRPLLRRSRDTPHRRGHD